jgi:hypothetical protein
MACRVPKERAHGVASALAKMRVGEGNFGRFRFARPFSGVRTVGLSAWYGN